MTSQPDNGHSELTEQSTAAPATKGESNNTNPSADHPAKPRAHPKAEQLRQVADYLETMQGPGEPGTGQERQNDPTMLNTVVSPDDQTGRMIRDGVTGQRRTTLNLDHAWSGNGEVSGLPGVVLTTFPLEADAAADEIEIKTNGEVATPEAITRKVLELNDLEARALLDGPNHSGAARRWITPQQTAEACRLTADGAKPEKVWPTVDREMIHNAAETEKLTKHDHRVIHEQLDQWEETETDRRSDPPRTDKQNAEARENAKRELTEQHTEEKSKHLISPSARIDPTARIARQVGIHDRAEIGAEARIGTETTIEHDSKVGWDCSIDRGCHILKRATINDQTIVGQNSRIGTAARIGPKCYLKTNVTVGDEAVISDLTSVGDGSKIGEDAQIGRRVDIGSHCRIQQKATVGAETTIGAKTLIQIGSRIGANAELAHDVKTGWQSKVGANAKIGEGTKVEPYAEVPEGTTVRPYSVVSAPQHNLANDTQPKPAQAVIRGAGRPVGGGTPQPTERNPEPTRE